MANDNPVQSGLDAISPNEPVAVGTVKAAASKGPYSLGTPTGATGYDPELLQNMQKLIDEKQAQKNSFMENLKDATAWWSGGVAGPAQALQNRAAEKDRQEAELFSMKSQLSQAKIAQQLAASQDARLFGNPSNASTTNTLPPSHITAGGPTTASTMVQQGGLLGLVKDPDLRTSIAAQASRGDRNGAEKAIQEYLAKNATDTDMIKDVNWMLRNNLIDPKLIPPAVLTKFAGAAAFVPHDVRGVGGTGQATPFGAASAMSAPGANAGAIPGAGPAPAPAPATQAPQVTKPVPPPPPAIPAVRPATTAPATTAPATTAPATTAPAAPQISPVESQIRSLGLKPASKEANELRQKMGETLISGQGKQLDKVQEAAGDRLTKMRSLNEAATSTIPTAQSVIDIANHPQLSKVMGLAHGTNTGATALTSIGDFVPGIGSEKVEKAIVSNYLNDNERAAYQTVQTASQKLGIDYAADVFKGARMGIGLEKMAMGAKGVGTEKSAAVNKQNASLIRDAAIFQQNKAKLWDDWKPTHGGDLADFDKFESSPEYSQLRDAAQKHFLDTYKGIVKPLDQIRHPAEDLVDKYRTKKSS